MLGDGRRGYYSEDLAPVVPEPSVTFESIRRSSEAVTWQWIGYAALAAGAIGAVVSFATLPEPGDEAFTGPSPLPVYLGC